MFSCVLTVNEHSESSGKLGDDFYVHSGMLLERKGNVKTVPVVLSCCNNSVLLLS